MEKVNRNSSIELLKIIAIVFIIMCHSVPYSGLINGIHFFDPTLATEKIDELLLIIFRYLGGFGNVIFIICSSYFLIDNDKVKMSKILSIIITSFFISICFLMVGILMKLNLKFDVMLKQFFPITFNNTWFITCYILLYIFHPFLNKVINNSNKKELFKINLIFFVLYSIISFIIKDNFYYNEMIGFIILYFYTAYYKKYLQKDGIKQENKILCVSIILFLLMIVVTNILGLKLNIFKDKMTHWAKPLNPLTVLICFILFNKFCKINFHNRKINIISSLSLIVYLLHENYIFREYIKPQYYTKIIGQNLIYGYFKLFIIILLFSFTFAMIYKSTINKLIIKLSEWIEFTINKIYCKFEKKVINL